jgi:iron complex transport system substrate-binding protein
VPGHEKVVAALAAQRDLNLLVLSPQSLADVRRDITLVARLLGLPQRAEAICAELEPAPAPTGPRPRLLVEWWPRPCIAAGRRSWVQDLIEAAGGQNALNEDCTSRPLAPGEAERLQPDAVVISWCGVPERNYRPEVVLRREGWGQIPAVQRGAVHPITEAWLGRPGPRLVDGLRALRAVVQACGG